MSDSHVANLPGCEDPAGVGTDLNNDNQSRTVSPAAGEVFPEGPTLSGSRTDGLRSGTELVCQSDLSHYCDHSGLGDDAREERVEVHFGQPVGVHLILFLD